MNLKRALIQLTAIVALWSSSITWADDAVVRYQLVQEITYFDNSMLGELSTVGNLPSLNPSVLQARSVIEIHDSEALWHLSDGDDFVASSHECGEILTIRTSSGQGSSPVRTSSAPVSQPSSGYTSSTGGGTNNSPSRTPSSTNAGLSTRALRDEKIFFRQLQKHPEILRSMSPRAFEKIVAHLLGAQGYYTSLTPVSNDGGFDVLAKRSDLVGEFVFLVECKRYVPPNKVHVGIVRSLHGVVSERKANAGVIVTTSTFTAGAKNFQQRLPHRLKLVDFAGLQEWIDLAAEAGSRRSPTQEV